jgi:broad specificity phosphatase PhoE
MTTWWWVRHGPTHERNFVGWRDVPADLSDHARIARLNAYLPDDALVVSSDLIRASATADRLSETRTRLPHAPQIRELNFGDWDGLGFAEVAARDPDLSRAYWEDPGDITAPNGESWNDLSTRITPFVDAVNQEHPGRNIIAVAHFGVIMSQIQRAKGSTAYEALGHVIDNLSVTRITTHGTWDVDPINHTP